MVILALVIRAIGVRISRLMRLTVFLLILMLIGLLPANIYSAINRVDFGEHGFGPAYLFVCESAIPGIAASVVLLLWIRGLQITFES